MSLLLYFNLAMWAKGFRLWKNKIATKLLARSSEVSKLSSNAVSVDSKPVYLPLHIFSKKARSFKHYTKTGASALTQSIYFWSTNNWVGGRGKERILVILMSAFGSVVCILTHFLPNLISTVINLYMLIFDPFWNSRKYF